MPFNRIIYKLIYFNLLFEYRNYTNQFEFHIVIPIKKFNQLKSEIYNINKMSLLIEFYKIS